MAIGGELWVKLVVVGQSFMLHQIRKMVRGLRLCLVLCVYVHFQVAGCDSVGLVVVGQSFMLHQIRKMVRGLCLCLVLCVYVHFQVAGCDSVGLVVVGQSFMLHQIRKMVSGLQGLTVLEVCCICPLACGFALTACCTFLFDVLPA
jgi:tRNA U38,U39,U40 pseudouridine synthase TruA